MEFPKLKRILTDPDEFISNRQLKALGMELLELIPMDGIEGLMTQIRFESEFVEMG